LARIRAAFVDISPWDRSLGGSRVSLERSRDEGNPIDSAFLRSVSWIFEWNCSKKFMQGKALLILIFELQTNQLSFKTHSKKGSYARARFAMMFFKNKIATMPTIFTHP
jgi:hypothetical protein